MSGAHYREDGARKIIKKRRFKFSKNDGKREGWKNKSLRINDYLLWIDGLKRTTYTPARGGHPTVFASFVSI